VRKAILDGDATALKRTAHSLNGGSASVGARTMSELAGELEKLGRRGELGEAPGMLAKLEAEFEQVRETLQPLRITEGLGEAAKERMNG
jgi:HPt (histidine-containing phosphotransfer) domain-containing protein